jgi:hypothetical protein
MVACAPIQKTAKQGFLMILAVCLAGVAGADARIPAWDVSAQQAKPLPAVPLISNPILPRDGVVTPKLTELWSVGGENDPQGDLINRPLEVRFAADGTVYVLDWGDVCIRVFDANGKLLRQVGRKGQGPGEFDTPFYFDVDAQGRIHTIDMRSLRVTRFDRSGKYETSFRLEKIARLLQVDAKGRIYTCEEPTGEPTLTTEEKIVQRYLTVVRYDPDGRNPIRVGPFKSMKMIMKAMPGGGVFSGSSREAPQTGWAIAPDGRLWIGYNETYEMGVYDPDGKLQFRFGREFKPIKSKIYLSIAPENRRPGIHTEFFPAYAPEVFFDEAGNAWLRLFRNDDKSEPYRYDVFSPQGVYLKQYVLPCRIYQVRNGKMIAVDETEEGFRVLKCYRY